MFVVIVLFVVVVVVVVLFVVVVFVDDGIIQCLLVPVQFLNVIHTKYIVSAVLVMLTGGACMDFYFSS